MLVTQEGAAEPHCLTKPAEAERVGGATSHVQPLDVEMAWKGGVKREDDPGSWDLSASALKETKVLTEGWGT